MAVQVCDAALTEKAVFPNERTKGAGKKVSRLFIFYDDATDMLQKVRNT